ncbi:hypothetical protein [Nocardiopsis sp. JB363]|uniref:hypothetical protein n=1 Tax=Nocardiopsis sp. JB363 TaxID=1434837 RepID=UPI00097A1705|nr:hypothetical protein [Nocardiopsis sp. JB363]SIO90317.1 hypothetical protein BQ8420_26040 [Nocardiopsis sp. JB363]
MTESPQDATPPMLRQQQTVEEIARALVEIMPEDWQNVIYLTRQVGGFTFEDLIAGSTDGTIREFVPPEPVRVLATELKDLGEKPGAGTWFEARISVEAAGRFRVEYEYDEVAVPNGLAPLAYAQEMRRYPRTPEEIPGWMRTHLEQARTFDLGPVHADFGDVLVRAFQEEGLRIEYLPPTSVRLLVPGHGPFAPSDMVETFERAVVATTARWPRIAAGVAGLTAENARRQGLIATPDDTAMAALRRAFAGYGTQIAFRGTDTLLVPLPSGRNATTDITGFRAAMEGHLPEHIAYHADVLAREMNEQIARAVAEGKV